MFIVVIADPLKLDLRDLGKFCGPYASIHDARKDLLHKGWRNIPQGDSLYIVFEKTADGVEKRAYIIGLEELI